MEPAQSLEPDRPLDPDQRWDHPAHWKVLDREELATGRVCNFVNDTVEAPDGQTFRRQYVTHPGAVAIIALDEDDRVVVVRQYRHPVSMVLVEPPAGLLDVEGESPLDAAARELAEEAMLSAQDWRVLVDVATSPGGCAETLRIYLARDLSSAPRPEGFSPVDEEAHMSVSREPLDDLVEAILAGHCQSPSLVAGVMSLALARARGEVDQLRHADSPWPARESA